MRSDRLLDLASRHSDTLAALWRKVAAAGASPDGRDDDDGEHEVGAAHPRSSAPRRPADKVSLRGERSGRRALLLGMLRVYGAAEHTPKLCDASAVYDDCTRLIGHADHKIQGAALDVIGRWSQPAINKYKDQLHGLISDKSFRETLTLFAVDERLEDAMLPQHRPVVLPMLTTLLYAKLTTRSGRGSSKNSMAQRRATIFAFFCAFKPAELRHLIDILLAPLAAVGAR